MDRYLFKLKTRWLYLRLNGVLYGSAGDRTRNEASKAAE